MRNVRASILQAVTLTYHAVIDRNLILTLLHEYVPYLWDG